MSLNKKGNIKENSAPPPMPQHLAFALTEPTFGKKAQGQAMGADMPATLLVAQACYIPF